MGTLTVNAATGAGTVYNHAFTIPDADMTRIVQAYQSAANTDINGTATPTQVFTYVVKQWIAKMSGDVVNFQSQAAIAALAAPAPVSAT